MRVKFALLTTEPITISPHVLRPTFWAFAARIGLTSLFDSDSDADINITECECHPLRAPSAARDSRMRASSRSPQTTKCVLNTSPVTDHQRTRYGINVLSKQPPCSVFDSSTETVLTLSGTLLGQLPNLLGRIPVPVCGQR